MRWPWRDRDPGNSPGGRASYGKTDAGIRRANNEDAFGALDDLGLYLVADGLGGLPSGEIASALAVQTAAAAMRETVPSATESPGDLLVAAVRRANLAVIQSAGASVERRGMATTLSALLLLGEDAHVAHVGDCRIYRWRGGKPLERLTRDHTQAQTLVDRGHLTEERAARHPLSHSLERALGAGPELDVDHRSERRGAGDRFLLCSDGLIRVVRDEEIGDTLSGHSTPQQQVEHLIDLALERGAPDNVTVIVVVDGIAALESG